MTTPGWRLSPHGWSALSSCGAAGCDRDGTADRQRAGHGRASIPKTGNTASPASRGMTWLGDKCAYVGLPADSQDGFALDRTQRIARYGRSVVVRTSADMTSSSVLRCRVRSDTLKSSQAVVLRTPAAMASSSHATNCCRSGSEVCSHRGHFAGLHRVMEACSLRARSTRLGS